MKTLILDAIAAACAVCLLANFDVTQFLGAHPVWSVNVAYYGAVPGIVLAVGLAYLTRFALYFAVLDLSLSAGIVWWGKRMFVASNGENTLGGQMWFLGWIAVCACVVAVLALLAQKVLNR